MSLVHLRGAPGTHPGSNFFHFRAVFGGKFGEINRLAPPPWGLAHPSLGNPRSDTEYTILYCYYVVF